MSDSQVSVQNQCSHSRPTRLAWGKVPLHRRSIRYVKGVGPHRMDKLAQLGIVTIEDACYYLPRRYEDRTRLAAIGEIKPNETATIRARLLSKSMRRLPRGQTIVEATVGDSSGVCYCLWFNQPYLAQQLNIGEELILYGKFEPGAKAKMIHPEMERVEFDGADSLQMGRIVPVYSLAAGIGQRWLRQVIAVILEEHAKEIEEWLPESLRRSYGWPDLSAAIREVHFPSSWQMLDVCRKRLAFEELFLLQLALAQRRSRTLAERKPQRYRLDGVLIRALQTQLPFKLTSSQARVLEEILSDLSKSSPMHRLLQGDVGCGKTIVLVFLIAVAVQSGYQAALMVPTELLAEQHARVLENYLGPLGVSVGLFSQGVSKSERTRCAEAVANGKLSVAIGTHALIQGHLTFKRLSLVIIDEQHKFGVLQRVSLAKKAAMPDVLVLTATPIPRTLALSIYGDLDISTITEMPPIRSTVTTRWLREAQREELYAMMRQCLGRGEQAYVVYPLVDSCNATYAYASGLLRGPAPLFRSELKTATQMAAHLQKEIFPAFRIGLLHGQMKPHEKERIMLAFLRGELQLLVSTVIVEVGLDVPNATIMVIEHPERFGLAQLHQLRGRIGRGGLAATCVLISDETDETVRDRLDTFVNTADGFKLAEKDLESRGPGQLLGHLQKGYLRFRVADLAKDGELLEKARKEAYPIIERNPQLTDKSLKALRSRLVRFRKEAA